MSTNVQVFYNTSVTVSQITVILIHVQLAYFNASRTSAFLLIAVSDYTNSAWIWNDLVIADKFPASGPNMNARHNWRSDVATWHENSNM